MLLDGRVVATWTRTLGRAGIRVAVASLGALTPAQRRAIGAAAERYAGFLGQPIAGIAFTPA